MCWIMPLIAATHLTIVFTQESRSASAQRSSLPSRQYPRLPLRDRSAHHLGAGIGTHRDRQFKTLHPGSSAMDVPAAPDHHRHSDTADRPSRARTVTDQHQNVNRHRSHRERRGIPSLILRLGQVLKKQCRAREYADFVPQTNTSAYVEMVCRLGEAGLRQVRQGCGRWRRGRVRPSSTGGRSTRAGNLGRHLRLSGQRGGDLSDVRVVVHKRSVDVEQNRGDDADHPNQLAAPGLPPGRRWQPADRRRRLSQMRLPPCHTGEFVQP